MFEYTIYYTLNRIFPIYGHSQEIKSLYLSVYQAFNYWHLL